MLQFCEITMQTSSNSVDSKLFKRDPRQLQGPQEGFKEKHLNI